MKRKYALYPIIMSACALLCFIAVVIVFAGVVQPLWGRMAILVLPALILGVVAFFAVKGKLGVSATTIWTTILSIVLYSLRYSMCSFLAYGQRRLQLPTFSITAELMHRSMKKMW